MPTKGREGHDMGRPDGVPEHPAPKSGHENPGYETQDVNVGGVLYFLGGLAGFVLIFFFVCFYLGKVINYGFLKQDGEPDRWHPFAQVHQAQLTNLKPNEQAEQQELAKLTASFPTPRVVADDSNQETADLHAREDLLLDNYSSDNKGTLRVPIDRAMQLIAQQGLGAAPATSNPQPLMVGDSVPVIHAPLTTGFARTGYELDTIAAREQKLEYNSATADHKEH